MALSAPPFNDPQSAAYQVARQVLMQRIKDGVRSRHGLTYAFRENTVSDGTGGVFRFGCAIHDVEAVPAAVKAIKTRVEGLQRGNVGTAELARARSQVRQKYRSRFDTTSRVAGLLGRALRHKQGPDAIVAHDEALGAVDVTAIQRVAAEYFGRRSPIYATGPSKAMEALVADESLTVREVKQQER